jgi:O-antigen/teichoic acid export membrane protein
MSWEPDRCASTAWVWNVSLRSIFLSTSFILLVIRLTGAGAGFLSQLVLARLLAPEALGVFFAVTSLAAVLGLVTSLGYPDIVARFISRYEERLRPRWTGAFIHRAFADILFVGMAAGALVVAAAAVWPEVPAGTRIAYALAGAAVPLLALFGMNYSIAVANRAFGAAYGPESLMRPILFLVVLAAFLVLDAALSLVTVTALFFGITILMGGLQFIMIRRRIPVRVRQAPRRLPGHWRSEGLPLIAVALYTNLFADLAIILAFPLIAPADLAAFGISLKLALLVGFCVQVAHQVILPDLAEAHARRALGRTTDKLLAASFLPLAFTLAATVAAGLGGEHVLALFHPDFAKAKWVLTILIACQLVRAFAGPSALLLTTIGAQRLNATVCVASTVVLAVGNFALIPAFGMIGAATAVLLAYAFWLAVSAAVLAREASIRCDLIALMRSRSRIVATSRP